MHSDSRPFIVRYLPYRRWVETGYFVFHSLLQASINSTVVAFDLGRVNLGFAPWQPVVWEFSSSLVMLALVPAVLAYERRFPLQYSQWRRSLPAHVVGSVAFCLLHVTGMVALRKLAYSLNGVSYDFGNWPRELFYEYLKDWQTYLGLLTLIYLYRFVLLRLQGEARLLDAPEDGPELEPVERPERFLVKKLGKEFLIAAAEVEYLQASGNYVNLHLHSRDYPLRTTMAAIEPRMDPNKFVRVHRSYMVNLDFIKEMEPLDTGDARIAMKDGSVVPCSRRYRAALKG